MTMEPQWHTYRPVVKPLCVGPLRWVPVTGLEPESLAGLNLGERVVTVGAYQVRLASLSGGDFAGGHSH